MSLEVEVAEGNCPLEGCDEHEAEEHTDGLKEHDHRVDLDVVDLLPEVVVELVGVDQEVTSEKSRNSETEQKTLNIDHKLRNKKTRGENTEPFEQIAVGNVTDKRASGTFCSDRVGEGRLEDLGLRPEEA